MRADLQRATSPHIWLVAIGQQLRDEYTDGAKSPEPLPEHLATRLERLEAGETQPEPAAIRLAIINAIVRASVARGSRAAVSSVHEEWSAPENRGTPKSSTGQKVRRRSWSAGPPKPCRSSRSGSLGASLPRGSRARGQRAGARSPALRP